MFLFRPPLPQSESSHRLEFNCCKKQSHIRWPMSLKNCSLLIVPSGLSTMYANSNLLMMFFTFRNQESKCNVDMTSESLIASFTSTGVIPTLLRSQYLIARNCVVNHSGNRPSSPSTAVEVAVSGSPNNSLQNFNAIFSEQSNLLIPHTSHPYMSRSVLRVKWGYTRVQLSSSSSSTGSWPEDFNTSSRMVYEITITLSGMEALTDSGCTRTHLRGPRI